MFTVQTTSRKKFDNPKTRKIRKSLRVRIIQGISLPEKLVGKLQKSDPKAYHYYTYMQKVLS